MPNLMLNSQGRIIADFILTKCPGFDFEENQKLYLDVHKEAAEDVISTLKKFRLKMKVDITDITKAMDVYQKFFLFSDITERGQQVPFIQENEEQSNDPLDKCTAIFDPRVSNLGIRIIAPSDSIEVEQSNDKTQIVPVTIYHLLRMFYGVAEYPETKGRIPLSFNLHKSAHISLSKGCYVGQELINRTYRQGNIRKTVLPFVVDPPSSMLSQFLQVEQKGLIIPTDFLNERYKLNLKGKSILKDKIKIGQIVANIHNFGLAYIDPTYVLNQDKTNKLVNCFVEESQIYFWDPFWLDYDLDKNKCE